MTPSARLLAAVELLDQILMSWQSGKRFPADKQINFYFKSNRYIGSKDRAYIGELVYWCLRHKATLEWHIRRHLPEHALKGRLYVLAALILRKDYTPDSIRDVLKGGKYSLRALFAEEERMCAALAGDTLDNPSMPDHARLNYPAWIEPYLRQSLKGDFEPAIRALSEQAPTDLRVNTLKTTREELMENLKKEKFETSATPMSPIGLRLAKRAPIFTSRYFKEGHFEVQDEGSQMVAKMVDAEPGQRVIDFCAGAGGKTLAVAAAMQNKGKILAWDTSEKRLGQIKERLRRAGVDTVETHVLESEHDQFIKRHKFSADRVLVDAPCSGTGTWRRNPDLKWRFTEKDLKEILEVQHSILCSASRLVKPGGRLIYATCSLLQEENEMQVEKLLKTVNDFRVVCAKKIWDKTLPAGEISEISYLWVAPHQDGVDGFFAAVLVRTAD